MAKIDVIVDYKSKGAKKATKEVDNLTKAQEKQEKQQKKSSDETGKSVPKLNAVAEALDQMGLTGASSLFSLSEGIGGVGKGLSGLKGAIVASGIGILVVAVAAAVENMMSLIEFTSAEATALRRLKSEIGALGADAIDLEAQIELQRLRGFEKTKSGLESIQESERELLAIRIASAEKELELSEDAEQRNTAANSLLKLLNEQQTLRLKQEIQLSEFEEAQSEERLKEIAEKKKAYKAYYNSRADEAKRVAELEQLLSEQATDQFEAASQERAASAEESIAKALEAARKGLTELDTLDDEDVETEEEILFDKRAAALLRWEQFKYEQKKKGVDAEKELESMRVDIATEGIAAIAGLASAVTRDAKRAFNINKAAQLAETIIGTYTGAQKAYNSQLTVPSPDAPIRAAVAAGVSIAQGLARVAAIKKTTFGGGGGGAPSSGGGGGGSSATQFLVPQTQQTQPGATQPAPVQAFVIGQEITNQQALDSELRTRSRL